MMKTFKKALAVFMCVVMALTAAPLSGFVGFELPSLFDFEAEAATYSGKCGTNLKWSLDTSTGVLNITGTGTMTNWTYSSSSSVPWYSYRSSIKTVNISSGVTSIGSYAFYFCSSLASVTIPGSVTSVGSEAFDGCYALKDVYYTGDISSWLNISFSSSYSNPLFYGAKLYFDGELVTDIVIPDGTKSVKKYAFYGCTSLMSVTISDSVTSIGSSAFYGCKSLASITISDSVTSIDDYAFHGCTSLTSFTVDEGNANYSSDEYGVLFNKNKTRLIRYPEGNEHTSYTISDSVKSIDDYAFHGCTSLTSITIPDSVTSIGYDAFYGCTSLMSVTIGDSVTSIDDYAFYGCRSLTSVSIPDSVRSIGYKAFDGCSKLVLMLKKDSYAETYAKNNSLLYYYSFDGSEDKTISVTVTSNLSFEIDKEAYTMTINCSGNMVSFDDEDAPWAAYEPYIKHVIISDGCTSICGNAFKNMWGITSVTIPDSVTRIGKYAFCGCTSLTSVTISDSVTSIGEYAFENCTSLTSVTIGNSVTSIGKYAFENCTSLTSVTIPDSVTSIGFWAFCDCESLTSVTIGNGVTSIADVFTGCDSLTSVTIGNGVTSIDDAEFNGCSSLTSFTVDAGNKKYSSNEYGVLFNKNKTQLIRYPLGNERASYTIPDSVTSIGNYAFFNCDNLTSITIPDSVTSIGKYAFEGCTSLTSVTIPDSVTSIGEHAFDYCTSLTSVTIGDSVTAINEYAFYNCTGLKELTMPASAKIYNSSYTFYGCSNIEKVTLTKGSGTMQNYGISTSSSYYQYTPWYISRNSLKELVIKDGIKNIGSYAFYDCTSLTSITIPDSVTSIGDYAFRHCTSLTSVTIPGSVTTIGNYAFYVCTGLTSVTIGDSVTSIGEYAFDGCRSLTSITIPDSVTSIGSSAFYGCTSLKELTMPVSAKIYNSSYTFYGCSNIEKVTLTKGSGTMQNYGTSTSSSATDTYYQYTPWYISRNSLKELVIKDGIKNIGSYAFYDCTSLTSITIPDSVTSIGNYAFKGCASLTSVTIGNGVKTIGASAYKGCSMLSDVYYMGTEAEWNNITIDDSYNIPLTTATIHYNHVHTYSQVSDVPSTCTVQGRNALICECGQISGYVTAPLAGHIPGEWSTVEEPTCEAEGQKVKRCTACGEVVETGVIAETGHTPGSLETIIEAKCETEGKMVQKCMVCSKELLSTTIPATGHTDGKWKITANPTTSAEGIKTLYCATCNEPLETAAVPKLDPVCDYLEWEVNEDNTVTITDCDTAYIGELSIPARISEYPVSAIGSSAFSNCDSITKITIPTTVNSIKDEGYSTVGFHTCDNLESIVVDEANEKYSSENGVLYNKEKTRLIAIPAKAINGEFVMPSTVTSVSVHAFYAHEGIKLTVSDNLETINCNYINASEFIASNNCANFATADGVLFNKAKTTLVRFPVSSDITEYDIPVGVESIDKYAFYESGIKKIRLPNTIINFGSNAFYGCEQLERVDYHCLNCWCLLQFENYSANPLCKGAALYINDEFVDDLDVGEMHEGGIEEISAYSFCGYEYFRSLTIPSTVRKIGSGAFQSCKKLKLLIVYGNVTDWGAEVFLNCSALYTVQFAEGTTKIGEFAFLGCNAVQELYIPSTMTWIGNGAFLGYNGYSDKQPIKKVCYGGYDWNNVGGISYNNTRLEDSIISYHKHTTASSTKLVDAVNPTCTETGYSGDRKNSYCLMYTSLGTTVSATGHSYEAVVTAPTCTESGYATHTCSVCGDSYTDTETEATGHSYETVATKITCTTDGYTTHTCSACGDTYTDSVVKAEGHKYDSVVTPNTCTKDGYTTHTCSVCEDTYTDSETKATGHSHESKVTKEPTCTNTGIRTFTCHCGDSYTEVIKANGHSKGDWEYIGGKEYAKLCTVCGDKLESKIVTVDMFFNGENVNKKQVINKSTATITATVTDNFANDLVFASSDSSTVSVDANGTLVANDVGKATITVTIKGTAISDSIEVEVLPRDFTITWNVNGKQTKQTVKEEAKFTPNVNTTLKGYKFIGWDKTVPVTMPAENLTFTAQYELLIKQLKIKNPSVTTINYGETLVMHADFGGVELPEGWSIQWTVEGSGFTMTTEENGMKCKITSVANGNATVKATLVDENGEVALDANGNEMSDSKNLTSKAGFFQKLANFFKSLFGISRIILQSI